MSRMKLRSYALPLFMLAIVTFQAGCALSHATLPRRQSTWRCETLLRQPSTRERTRVTSDPPFNPLPGATSPRFFTAVDRTGDGIADVNDVRVDWHRYIHNIILASPRFATRRWCIEPMTTNCTENLGPPFVLPPRDLPADDPLFTCPREPRRDEQLEISAPGLGAEAPDYTLSLPDTPIGSASSPVTFILRNAGMTPIRINSTDFLNTTDRSDFEQPGSSDCLPTEDESRRFLGRELRGGGTCSFQVTFRPQNRSGSECDRDDASNTSCRRVAVLRITSETLSGQVLPSFTVTFMGRAIGGRLVVEPAEICFPRVPPSSMCTDEEQITFRNDGTGNVRIYLAFTNLREDFRVDPVRYAGITLIPGDNRTVRVRYCERGDRVDNTYTIISTAPRNPSAIVAVFNPNNRTCP